MAAKKKFSQKAANKAVVQCLESIVNSVNLLSAANASLRLRVEGLEIQASDLQDACDELIKRTEWCKHLKRPVSK